MANDKIVDIIGEGGLNELDRLIASLEKADALIVQFNNDAKRSELKIQGAEKVSEFNVAVNEGISNLNKISKAERDFQKEIEKTAKENEKRLVAIFALYHFNVCYQVFKVFYELP